jgi:hypothetical protein
MAYLNIAFKHKVEKLRKAMFGEEQEKNVACNSCMFFSNSYSRNFQTIMKCFEKFFFCPLQRHLKYLT